jgi:hypothetical protein
VTLNKSEVAHCALSLVALALALAEKSFDDPMRQIIYLKTFDTCFVGMLNCRYVLL